MNGIFGKSKDDGSSSTPASQVGHLEAVVKYQNILN